MLVYEDNFGFWDIGNPEERIFFGHVQRQSVLIACERCERPVRLIPPKALCAVARRDDARCAPYSGSTSGTGGPGTLRPLMAFAP